MSSADNRMHIYDSTNQLWRRAEGTATGILKSETTLDKTGLATDTLQTSGNASLTSMDGKMTVCNTGAVIISSGSVTESNSAGILADLSVVAGDTTSLDAKVTACDTGAVVVSSGNITEANSGLILAQNTTIAGSVNSMDIKMTTCDTGNVVISSGSVTETNSSAIAGSLSSMDGKMSSGSDASLVNAQQMVVYGRDSTGGLDALKVDQQGHLEVIMDEASNKGSHENLASNVTINIGSYSSVVNIADMNVGNLFYEDSATASFDTVNIEVSIDGTNYFKYTEIYPSQDGAVRTTKETGLQLQGLKNLRLLNNSATDNYSNVKASIVGSP